MKSRINKQLVIGLVGALCTIVSVAMGDVMNTLVIALITLMALRSVYTAEFASLLFGVFVIMNVISNQLLGNLFSILFYGLITQTLYREWKMHSVGKTTVLIEMETGGQQYLVNLFIMLFIFNGFFTLIMTGFNVGEFLTLPVQYMLFKNVFGFMAVYLISKRIFEAVYFFIGYLLVEAIGTAFFAITIDQKVLMLFMPLVLQLIVSGLFIYNKRS